MEITREYHCNKTPNQFCYICGLWVPIRNRRPISERIRTLYRQYFNFDIKYQDKTWVPHFVCNSCSTRLGNWSKGKGHLRFGRPMIWTDPVNHDTNCYICLTKVIYSKTTRHSIEYALVGSATLPEPHSSNLPIPAAPAPCTDPTQQECMDIADVTHEEDIEDDRDPLYIPDTAETHKLTQEDYNDLVRDLYLTKDMSELLGSRLQQWKLLENTVRITSARDRSADLAKWFEVEDDICFCKDIPMLFAEMKEQFDQNEWRLFIDGSTTSIKAVLLHIGNEKPSVPIAYGAGLKEQVGTMKDILNYIQYGRFNFKIVADFKVISLLMGIQGGNVKFPCFLCLFDSRDRMNHYSRLNWPRRISFVIGTDNVKSLPIVRAEDIILPPLHIKLGLMRNFVCALTKTNSEAIDFLDVMFPQLSRVKVEAGIFTGPQIRKVVRSEEFKQCLTDDQKNAWESFKDVLTGFLGNFRDPDYVNKIDKMLENYEKIGANLSLKMHCLKSHKDVFPDLLGAWSDEHGERFHQEMSDIESRFNGQYTPNMLGEYCWFLVRDTKAIHKRRGPMKHF